MTWYVVVRHADPKQVAEIVCRCEGCQGKTKGGYYPPEGFPISAFADQAQAVGFAEASTSPNHRYEVVPVVRQCEVKGA